MKYDARQNVKLPVRPHISTFFINTHFSLFYTKQTSDCPHPPAIEIQSITAYFKPQRYRWRKTGHAQPPGWRSLPSVFQPVDVPSWTSQRNLSTPGLPRGKEAGNMSLSAYLSSMGEAPTFVPFHAGAWHTASLFRLGDAASFGCQVFWQHPNVVAQQLPSFQHEQKKTKNRLLYSYTVAVEMRPHMLM